MSNFLIRDHKLNPYAVTAENPAEAFAQLNLKPRNCTAEVLDTSVPYQKWDVVEVTRTPARQRQVAQTTVELTNPTTCVVCGNELAVPTRKRGEPKRFCSDKCRIKAFRNGNKPN